MKRFIFSVLAVTVFCVGLGSLAEHAGASLKSDEKALAIIRDARQAIGGDAAITSVRSMVIGGDVSRTMKVEGVERKMQGETEIALQLPDKMVKRVNFKHEGEKGDAKSFEKQLDVVIVGEMAPLADIEKDQAGGVGTGNGVKHIVIQKGDGTTQEYTGAEAEKIIAADRSNGAEARTIIINKPEGVRSGVNVETEKATTDGRMVQMKRIGGPEHDEMRHNEMLRLTFGLLLTAPQGMDVSYTFGGDADVDGTACNIVVAEFAGSAYKLFIGKSSNLPVMMTWTGEKTPNIVMFRTRSPEVGQQKDNVIFTTKVDAPPVETAEFSVKFSDYRSVNGLQLPYKWTQTIGGAADDIFNVTVYDINPANIADKFNNENVKVRVKQADQN